MKSAHPMTDVELMERHQKLLDEERARGVLVWCWLSFVGEEGFRGAVMLKAPGVLHALQESRRKGLNPGGEVKMVEAHDWEPSCPEFADRLLTREDIAEMDARMPT